jgi:DNA-binding MarR family transcriptional regulator
MKTNSSEFEKSNTAILEAIDYLAELETQADVKMLSAEGRLLKLIKSDPGHYIKYYLSLSGLSSRWFAILVDQLVEADLIARERCEKDIRGKRLS